MAMTLEKTIYALYLQLYKITYIKCNWHLHLDSHAGISKHLCVYTASILYCREHNQGPSCAYTAILHTCRSSAAASESPNSRSTRIWIS